MRTLKSIQHFNLGWATVTTETMTTIVNHCPFIRLLDLGYCTRLDDCSAAVIGQLGHLESLSLTGTHITDVGLGSIGSSESAATIKVSYIFKTLKIDG